MSDFLYYHDSGKKANKKVPLICFSTKKARQHHWKITDPGPHKYSWIIIEKPSNYKYSWIIMDNQFNDNHGNSSKSWQFTTIIFEETHGNQRFGPSKFDRGPRPPPETRVHPPRFSAQLSWCLLGLVLHPSYVPFLANVWHHQWTWDGGLALTSMDDGYSTFK